MQDEIAAAVVRGLKVTLLGELPEQRRTDPEVYTLYLQGHCFINLGGRENAQRAVQVLKQALVGVDADANYRKLLAIQNELKGLAEK